MAQSARQQASGYLMQMKRMANINKLWVIVVDKKKKKKYMAVVVLYSLPADTGKLSLITQTVIKCTDFPVKI